MAKPPIKGQRLLKLASMSASVAGSYARSRVGSLLGGEGHKREAIARFRKESGERIASTLGELKGAAMKVGQMASAARDLLPPEVADALTALQKQAPPMDYEAVVEVIEHELGASPTSLFRSFEEVPYASASVGQVHRAVLDDGRQAVVKVQYPGVDDAVDSDLAHVKLALRLGGLVTIEKEHLDAVFEELRARLHEELDYCNEAENARLFHEFHQRHDWIVVPEVIGERSSKRMLTMVYEPGHPLDALSSDGVDQRLRDTVGTAMARMITVQLFELHAVHGDPNPANFAWRDDGTLVVYDFGCIKRYEPDYVRSIVDLVSAARVRDYRGLDDALIRLGPLRPEHAPVPGTFYDGWLDCLCPPLWSQGPYDFGETDITEKFLRLLPGTIARQHWWKPAPELTIVDREVAGLYDSARNIRARVPLRELLEAHLPPRA